MKGRLDLSLDAWQKERKVPLGTLQAIFGFSEAQEHDALVCKAKVRATFACNTERMRESVSVRRNFESPKDGEIPWCFMYLWSSRRLHESF